MLLWSVCCLGTALAAALPLSGLDADNRLVAVPNYKATEAFDGNLPTADSDKVAIRQSATGEEDCVEIYQQFNPNNNIPVYVQCTNDNNEATGDVSRAYPQAELWIATAKLRAWLLDFLPGEREWNDVVYPRPFDWGQNGLDLSQIYVGDASRDGKFYEFPIIWGNDAPAYSGGPPGPDRVIVSEDLRYVASVTRRGHEGTSQMHFCAPVDVNNHLEQGSLPGWGATLSYTIPIYFVLSTLPSRLQHGAITLSKRAEHAAAELVDWLYGLF